MKSVITTLLKNQQKISQGLDRLLPRRFRVDGNHDFATSFAPRFLRPGMTIYDVGGGKHPFIPAAQVAELDLRVVGIDIDQQELAEAPAGAYHEIICTDITRYRGRGEADLVICRTLLEHVRDVDAAFAAIASILKPGGTALVFAPSRNAVFARLNLLFPESLKRRLLRSITPEDEHTRGFPSFYDRCTPRDFRTLGDHHHLRVEEERFYFLSSYLFFLVPTYLLWRTWVLGYRLVAGNQAAETFSMALKKAA